MTELDRRVSFDGSDAGSRRRGDRLQLARNVVLGVVALGAVAGAAMVIGTGGDSSSGSAQKAGVPRKGPVPPAVVFADAKLGYAAYDYCSTQSLVESCRATLMRTKDGAKSWQKVALPPGTPTDPSKWNPVQARDDLLVLSWTGGAAVSSNDGDAWRPVVLAAAGATTEVASGMIVNFGNGALALDLSHPDKPVAIPFQPGPDVDQPGSSTNALPDGGLWATYGLRLDISRNGGKTWTSGTMNRPGLVAPAPLLGSGGHDVRVAGTAGSLRIGIPGDGGEVAVSEIERTTNDGPTWTSTKVTGPRVNGFCTVLLKDGSLLGVSVDGKSLLRLPSGGTSFAPLQQQPAVVPSCLSTGNGQVWGSGFDGKFLIGEDTNSGVTWSVRSLPAGVRYGTIA